MPTVETFNFSEILFQIKEGKKASRLSWTKNGNEIFVELQKPNDNSKMTEPYIFITRIFKAKNEGEESIVERFPLSLGVDSLLADDWFIVE